MESKTTFILLGRFYKPSEIAGVSIVFMKFLNPHYSNVDIERFNIPSQRVTSLQSLILHKYNYIIDKHWLIKVVQKLVSKMRNILRIFYKNFIVSVTCMIENKINWKG